MGKLVVIAGIKRSGSTWLYNAVRLSILHAGRTVYIAGDGNNYDPRCKADFQIMKRHPYDPVLVDAADYIFTSDRDDDGIRESLKRAFDTELTDHRLKRMRNDLRRWRKRTDFHAEYDDILNNKQKIIKGVSQALGLAFSPEDVSEVLRQLEATKPPTDRNYDEVTFYFKNHITSR